MTSLILVFSEIPQVKGTSITRFRLGATIPTSVIAGFGRLHGVSIGLNYQGGVNFYKYMTKGPGFFAHIDIALRNIDFYDWGGEKEFLKGLLDAADADGGKCEISLSLYGVDLGWPSLWEAEFLELLDTIGPNRRSMRFIFLKGEWTYRDIEPPGFDELKADFLKAKEMVASYSYQLGWFGEGKYLTNIPKDKLPEFYSWGPRVRAGQISRSSDLAKGAQDCYNTANWWERPNDVLLSALTMWDTAANIPTTPPYYICYEKFESFIRGAADRFDESGGEYPQSVLFYVMPETFSDVVGVNCPYLDWWAEMAQKYNLRTSQTDPISVPKSSDVTPPASSFPPYPIGLKVGNKEQNLPPFQVQAGDEFEGYLQARNTHTWQALSNKEVEVHLVKRTLKDDLWNSYPLTKEELEKTILMGKVTTGSDGRASFKFKAPTEPGKYTLVAHIHETDTELEAFSDFTEFVLVVPKAHKVKISSNVKIRLSFGPDAYGPPWQGVDSERWIEPNKPLWGYCSEMEWEFIVPFQVTDENGKIWGFSHWEDGSTNPKRTIFVDKDLVLEAHYSELDARDPKMSSRISCSVSPSQLHKGDTVVISGSISPPVNGATVTLSYIKPDGSSFIQNVTTSSSGAYSKSFNPDNFGVYYVQASWSGNENYEGSISSQGSFNVTKRQSFITLSLSSSSIDIGDSLGTSGTLSPALSGTPITLSYRIQGGIWMVLRNLTTDSNGQFNYVWMDTPASKGIYEVKASWLGNDDYEGSSYNTSFSVVEVVVPQESDFSIDKPSYDLQQSTSEGKKEHVMEIELKVALPAPKFMLSVSPQIIMIPTLNGYNFTATIEVASLSNYTIEPLLSVSNIPAGIEIALNEDVLTIPKLSSRFTNLMIRSSENPPKQGNYSFFVECSYQGIVVKEEVKLILVDRFPTILVANLVPESVQYGDEVILKGSISPERLAGISVKISFENGTEVSMITFSTNASGEFSQGIPILLAEGEYDVKVSCENDAFYFGSFLNLTLKVKKAATFVTLSSNITEAVLNVPILLKGVVMTDEGKPIQNVDVVILISGNSGLQSAFARTDENGVYAAVISDLSPGEYNITSIVGDSDFYESATSEQVNLLVKNSIMPSFSDAFTSIMTGLAMTNLTLASVLIFVVIINLIFVVFSIIRSKIRTVRNNHPTKRN